MTIDQEKKGVHPRAAEAPVFAPESATREAIRRLRMVAAQCASDVAGPQNGLARDLLLVTRELEQAQPAVKALKRLVGLNNPTTEQHDRAWAEAERVVAAIQNAPKPGDGDAKSSTKAGSGMTK